MILVRERLRIEGDFYRIKIIIVEYLIRVYIFFESEFCFF